MLEKKYGWNGLCVDANFKYWPRLIYRQCQTVGAVVGHNRMEEVNFNFGPKRNPGGDSGLYGGIVGAKFDNAKVQQGEEEGTHYDKRYTVGLLEILERYNAPKSIDYLSLDVEGAEMYIMSGFPLDKYTIKVLTVERPKMISSSC